MSRQPPCQPWLLSHLLHERVVAMGMALERSSVNAYNSHLNSYLTFCCIHDHPITPTIDTLSFFIVYMSAHIHPDSVAVYLTGVCNRLEADFPEVRQHHANPVIKHTLAGCLRCTHQQPSWKPPLNLIHVHGFLHSPTPPSTHDDLLFAVLLVLGFHALMCLGELIWPDSIQLQSYRKVILRCSLKLDVDSFSFGLPTHKTLKVGHGSDVLVHCFSPNVEPHL
ncbi:hypothetical protein OG21DRAFT_1425537 [Imleria badia]|nr:hypothetical protein OG21DRAFT_1425537 [Imleria badia]